MIAITRPSRRRCCYEGPSTWEHNGKSLAVLRELRMQLRFRFRDPLAAPSGPVLFSSLVRRYEVRGVGGMGQGRETKRVNLVRGANSEAPAFVDML